MNMILLFTKLIAWPVMIGSGLLLAARLNAAVNYTDLQKKLDRLRGVTVTHPVKVPGSIFLVTLAWLIALHFGK